MVKYLCDKAYIRMTTAEEDVYKWEEYLRKWNTTKNIITYFEELKDFHDKLKVYGIVTSNGGKIIARVVRMFKSGYFMEDKLIKSEEKVEVDKTWDNVKAFFTKI